MASIESKFTKKQRQIFMFFDPDRSDREDGMIYADPFEIQESWTRAKLNNETQIDIDVEFDNLVSEKNMPEEVKFRSLKNIAPFLHKVFGTKTFQPDGSGITFDEVFDNLERWNEFSDDIKKNTEENLNSSTSTLQSQEEESILGKNTTGSPSTSPESSESQPIP